MNQENLILQAKKAQEAYMGYMETIFPDSRIPSFNQLSATLKNAWVAVARSFLFDINAVVIDSAKKIPGLDIITQDGLWFWKHKDLNIAQTASQTALEALINYTKFISANQQALPLSWYITASGKMGQNPEEQLQLNQPTIDWAKQRLTEMNDSSQP